MSNSFGCEVSASLCVAQIKVACDETLKVNISRLEQRVLQVLAQGGFINHLRRAGRIIAADCFSREGHRLTDCTLDLFRRLKRRRLIASRDGAPYRISRLGLDTVRAQLDNR